jgi:two-component system nitrogen regulation response regulator NtrX
MNKSNILIIDDEAGIRSSLKGILEDEGYHVLTSDTGEKGIWLPEMNGIDVLNEIKNQNSQIQVVMISGHGSVESAVIATKLGAYDYLEKPLSLEKVVLTVKNALKQSRLEEENIVLRESIRAKHKLVGSHLSIQKIQDAIKIAAPSNGCVMITGENGTGKELIARLICDLGPAKHKRFSQINC